MECRLPGVCHLRLSVKTAGELRRQDELESISAATIMPKNEFPPGWDERRVRELIAHYEGQTEEEAVAEDEEAFERQSTSMVEEPTELLPGVRGLLGKRGAQPRRGVLVHASKMPPSLFDRCERDCVSKAVSQDLSGRCRLELSQLRGSMSHEFAPPEEIPMRYSLM